MIQIYQMVDDWNPKSAFSFSRQIDELLQMCNSGPQFILRASIIYSISTQSTAGYQDGPRCENITLCAGLLHLTPQSKVQRRDKVVSKPVYSDS